MRCVSRLEAANTSDISIDNKIRICQAANTSDICIDNKMRTCQAANTSDINIKNKTHLMLISDVSAA
jgi:hypothetical protein